MNRVDVNGCCIKYLIIREWRLNKMVIMISEIQGKWLMKKANPKTHYFLFMRMLSYCKNLRWHSLRLLMSKDRVHFVTHFQTQKHLDKKNKGKMNIFHNSNKIPMCAGEIQWGYLFHLPARGQPSMTSNNDTSQVGGELHSSPLSVQASLYSRSFQQCAESCQILINVYF